jgi:hypothetical protein
MMTELRFQQLLKHSLGRIYKGFGRLTQRRVVYSVKQLTPIVLTELVQ